MKVITISGSARHGKDSTAELLKTLAEQDNKKAIIVHYADYLKYLCKEYFGWNGEKDESGRTLLQQIGTELCRKNNPNIWVNVVIELANAIHTEYDYMIIPDTRFKNEILEWEEWWNHCYEIITVKVERPDLDNGLTAEQKRHQSEVDLNDFEFDYTLKATNLHELKTAVTNLWRSL